MAQFYQVARCEQKPVWDQTQALGPLATLWGQAPAPATQFWAQHGPEGLHFRFEACEPQALAAPQPCAEERVRVLASSRVELFFSADAQLRRYHCFELSPWGDSLVYEASHYRVMDWQWRCPGLTWTVQRQRCSYSVQGLLPWHSLAAMGLQWGACAVPWHVGVFQAVWQPDPAQGGRFLWYPWCDPQSSKPDFHVPQAFGQFMLVDPPTEGIDQSPPSAAS